MLQLESRLAHFMWWMRWGTLSAGGSATVVGVLQLWSTGRETGDWRNTEKLTSRENRGVNRKGYSCIKRETGEKETCRTGSCWESLKKPETWNWGRWKEAGKNENIEVLKKMQERKTERKNKTELGRWERKTNALKKYESYTFLCYSGHSSFKKTRLKRNSRWFYLRRQPEMGSCIITFSSCCLQQRNIVMKPVSSLLLWCFQVEIYDVIWFNKHNNYLLEI